MLQFLYFKIENFNLYINLFKFLSTC